MRTGAATALALALAAALSAASATGRGSYGTLLECGRAGADEPRCLWVGRTGRAVSAADLARQLMEDEQLSETRDTAARRRLEAHMRHIEDVHTQAQRAGLALPYRTGVSARHLYADATRELSPRAFVAQEQRAAARRRARRRLQPADEDGDGDGTADGTGDGTGDESGDERVRSRGRRLSVPETLDWCSSDNPRGASVCTDVKSQQQCGSCWAFAAADAIEAAVVVRSRTAPQSLSPQQFLACSTRAMTATFEYCWVGADGAVPGAAWLDRKMTWGSDNNGCDGGMTHAAFEDAAAQRWGLLAQLDLPYDEQEDGSQEFARVCTHNASTASSASASPASRAAASIGGWEQAVGTSCDRSGDAGELLRAALQQQPVAVAINSGGAFKDYKQGVYACPDDGDMASSAAIDHALVLVGYGTETDPETRERVDFWLLKNSYGSSWGEEGFMRLAADNKINCGLSVFPVIPTGAEATAYRAQVDGGGDVVFCGLTPAAWIATGASLAVLTLVLTALGVVCARRRRRAMQLVGE